MKHLIGIICYKMTESLKLTVSLLTNDIVLLVDGKVDITHFQSLSDRVTFITNRPIITWGGLGQIKANLEIFRYAYDNGYDYVSVISESDLPMKTSGEMQQFLERNKGKDFIGISDYEKSDEARVKYSYPYAQRDFLGPMYDNKYWEKFPFSKLYKGCFFSTVSRDTIAGILKFIKDNPNYLNAYRYTFLGDELFIQTIVMNLEYLRNRIYAKDDPKDTRGALRYIDYSRGYWIWLYAENLLKYRLEEPHSFFMRKVSEKSDFDKYAVVFNHLKNAVI